jgi:hypothetical protein
LSGTTGFESKGSDSINTDSCGSYHLQLNNLAAGNYLSYEFGDKAILYVTGWIRVVDAATSLSDATDTVGVFGLATATNGYKTARLYLTNNGGTIQWEAMYYNDGDVISTTKYAYTSNQSEYFKIFYDNTNNTATISIGPNPETQTTLFTGAISTSRNSGQIHMGIIAQAGITANVLDIGYDSISIDTSGYKRVEYK